MGRPLNDRFFGNRNIGSVSTTTDNGIGGEGIASVSWSNLGSVLATSGSGTPLSGIQLPAPTLPGGVQATWTLVYGVDVVSTGAGRAGLYTGDLYTYPDIPGSSVQVASTSSSNATFTVLASGSTGTLITDTQGVNLTKVSGAGVGTFLVDVNQKIVSSNIVESGSGYTGVETITVTLANGATGQVPVTSAINLTTDSGIQNPSQNPAGENANAIIIYANTTGAGAKIGDIQKQVGSHRYRVKTADGVARVQLVASNTPAIGQAYIIATDSGGATYWVTKLTARRAVLTPRGDGTPQFPLVDNGEGGTQPVSAGWVLSGAVANQSVVVQNA